jgi:hypothetical protein
MLKSFLFLLITSFSAANFTGIVPNYLCTSFTIGPGTGCAWMCNYCETQLQTTNYYFLDNVCTYEPGGCVGNPIAGNNYICCTNN